MTSRNKKTHPKSKIKLKWWIIASLFLVIVITYFPQRTLNIQIVTAENTEELFQIEIEAGTEWVFHGTPGFKLREKRFITANKVHHIRVNGNLRPWYKGMYGKKVYVTVKHPEYRQLKLSDEGYRGKLLTAKPKRWADFLNKKPTLELDYPEQAYQPFDYKEQIADGRILIASEISRHLKWIVSSYPDLRPESIPVLRRLATYLETNSKGRHDISESKFGGTQNKLDWAKLSISTIIKELKPPVDWRFPAFGDFSVGTIKNINHISLSDDFNGDGRLDKIETLYQTDTGIYSTKVGLYAYYSEKLGFSKPVKINKNNFDKHEYKLHVLKAGHYTFHTPNNPHEINVEMKYKSVVRRNIGRDKHKYQYSEVYWFDGSDWQSMLVIK